MCGLILNIRFIHLLSKYDRVVSLYSPWKAEKKRKYLICNVHYFIVFFNQNNKYTEVVVNWKHSKFSNMHTNISFFDNPQIENGITIPEAMTTKDCVGLLMYNYKPKLMEIPSLTTLSYKKLHKRLKNSKNKFIDKKIISKNEQWLTIGANTVESVTNKDIKKY